MKYKIQICSSIIIIFLSLGCNSDDQNAPPSVITKSSQALSEGGVILSGNFQNFSSNAILGFEIYNNNIGSFIDVMLPNPTNGENMITITTGLYMNQAYKYRAYIRTELETYYGLEEEFLSTGSTEASFLSISPNQGNFKDTVEIVSDIVLSEAYIDDIIVLFNGKEAVNVSVNENSILCEVPYYNENHVSEIQVNYFGSIINTSLNYELLPPIIESISPSNITYRDEVVITGNHFEDVNSQYLKVYIDGFEASILERSKTSLKIKIPDEVESASPSIKVVSNLQEVELQNALTMKPPVITSYVTSGFIFDTMDIFVENISPIYYNNEVYFNGVLAVSYEHDDDNTSRITVKVPQGPYNDWNPTITVKTSDELFSIEYPFAILDSTIEILETEEIPLEGYQIFNNITYVYGFYNYFNTNPLIINKFSETNNEFYDEVAINMPVNSQRKIISTNDGYIYILYNRDQDNFFRVNLNNYTLESLTDFPDGTAKNLTTAINDNQIIIGINDKENFNQGSFYNYSIKNDIWQLMSSTFSLPISKSFYSENESYFIKEKYSNPNNLYRFDGNDTYVVISSNFPSQFRDYYTTNYAFRDGKFYFFEGNSPDRNFMNRMMIFDVTNYSWLEKFDVLPNDGYNISGIFSKGDYIYIQVTAYGPNYRLLKLDLNAI